MYLNIEDYKKGFFNVYSNLKKDYFNIKDNIEDLKHEDTISSTFFILEGIEELIIKYNITKYCFKCNPLGKTNNEKRFLLFTYDNNDIKKYTTLEDLINEKFKYDKSVCPKCDYSEEGKIINSTNLITIVSNLELPKIIFINI